MTSIRIRPRFRVETDLKIAEVQQAIHDAIHKDDSPCTGVIVPGFVTLKIPPSERHFWSPQLTLNIEEEEGRTLIRGLYGPNPTVWAIFTLGFGAAAILGFFSLVLGLAQVTLKYNPWGLWLVLLFAVIAFVLYLASQAGQKLGVEQTFDIHHFLQETLDIKVHIG